MTTRAAKVDEGWDAALISGVGPTPVTPASLLPPVTVKPRFRSRFFFRPLNQDDLEVHRHQSAPPKIEYADQTLTRQIKAVKVDLPKDMASNIDTVRDFFVRELAPLTLALDPGSTQARDILKAVVGTEMSPEPFYRFENMASKAVLIRMAHFLEDYLGLPEGTADSLLHQPRSPAQASPQAETPDQEREPPRTLRKLTTTLQRMLDRSSGDANGRPITPTEG